jgi:hypothetical protein
MITYDKLLALRDGRPETDQHHMWNQSAMSFGSSKNLMKVMASSLAGRPHLRRYPRRG